MVGCGIGKVAVMNMALVYGSCTHVWNYAQANYLICFLKMEMNTEGNGNFLLVKLRMGTKHFALHFLFRPIRHNFHAAADGQLGGIMKYTVIGIYMVMTNG